MSHTTLVFFGGGKVSPPHPRWLSCSHKEALWHMFYMKDTLPPVLTHTESYLLGAASDLLGLFCPFHIHVQVVALPGGSTHDSENVNFTSMKQLQD